MSERHGMKWFGKSWGAPFCDPANHLDTPTPSPCMQCGQTFDAESQGVEFLYFDGEAWRIRGSHFNCFLKCLGIELPPSIHWQWSARGPEMAEREVRCNSCGQSVRVMMQALSDGEFLRMLPSIECPECKERALNFVDP